MLCTNELSSHNTLKAILFSYRLTEAVLFPPYKASKMAGFLTKSDSSMWQDHDYGGLVHMLASMAEGEGEVCPAAVVSAAAALVKQALGLWSHLPTAAEVFAPLLKNVNL